MRMTYILLIVYLLLREITLAGIDLPIDRPDRVLGYAELKIFDGSSDRLDKRKPLELIKDAPRIAHFIFAVRSANTRQSKFISSSSRSRWVISMSESGEPLEAYYTADYLMPTLIIVPYEVTMMKDTIIIGKRKTNKREGLYVAPASLDRSLLRILSGW